MVVASLHDSLIENDMVGIADSFVLVSTTRTLDGFVRRFDHLLNDVVSERCRFSLALSQS